MSNKIMVQTEGKPRTISVQIANREFNTTGTWSRGVIVPVGARLLFPGGFTSRDRDGNVVAPYDTAGQTRQILENMKAYLEELGASLADVVKVTVYFRDMRDWEAHHAVRREYFPVDPPASCLVQVTRMVDERHMLEIDPIVALPGE
jgi:enamine deaminase RidA (YjgF/YER057c/UK114 family)